ncbi:hypothetical protein [Qipengyuania sp.]|uniref:hypothetical protein n=1 Tax=Qipengyuania sp. TaxID=2004515 RepID=UPI0035C8551A
MAKGRLMIAAVAAMALSGCSTYGYDSGYSRVSVGVGNGYYDRGYYDRGYYGWYDGYYYPGTGYYVFDRRGQRHRWNRAHQRYWQARRAHLRNHRGLRENWSGYEGVRPGHRERHVDRGDRRGDRHGDRYERRGSYRDQRPVARPGMRAERLQAERLQAERQRAARERAERAQSQRESRAERRESRAERRESVRGERRIERRPERRMERRSDRGVRQDINPSRLNDE